jgi:hypothetical protein
MSKTLTPLPFAGAHSCWAYQVSGVQQQGWELSYFAAEDPKLGLDWESNLKSVLPLLFHDFEAKHELAVWLQSSSGQGPSLLHPWGPSPKSILKRILPRLLSYRLHPESQQREYIFRGYRPSSLHILERVFEGGCPFWLEDMSHFATHGELIVEVLEHIDHSACLDPRAILYAPAVDAPFPFKFALVSRSDPDNRTVYVNLLSRILKQCESNETFRARHFKVLMRGFQKFGTAAATPAFQNVERDIWKLLSYLAARLRVKAGQLTGCTHSAQLPKFLAELRQVNHVLREMIDLPSRMAAYFRQHFELELSDLARHTQSELLRMAPLVDYDLNDQQQDLDSVVKTIYEFQQLGVESARESLMLKDHDIKQSYTTEILDWPEKPAIRSYSDKIFTGARRFDKRRFRRSSDTFKNLKIEDEELDLDLNSPFDFGQGSRDSGIDSGRFDITLDWED